MLLHRLPAFAQVLNQVSGYQRELDRWVRQFQEGSTGRATTAGYPPLNVWEDADHVMIEAELPGYTLENLDVQIVGQDQLMLSGQRHAPKLEKAVSRHQERHFGSFTRTVTLPTKVDPKNVEASLENGVLTIKIAKAVEAKPMKIQVKGQ
jgi:HSP20 family protein